VFMDAMGRIPRTFRAPSPRPSATADEHTEQARVGGASVFFAWPQGAAAGYEGAVTVDGFLGIDGLW
jgi:hypothetical protein